MECDSLKKILAWIIQILYWFAWIFFIISDIIDDDLETASIIVLSITFSIYFICALFSTTLRYTCNKRGIESIHNYMLSIFKQNPNLTFSVVCYHNEQTHHTTTDKDGKTTHHTSTRRVVTHRETEVFRYYSSRDISGLFRLNTEGTRVDINKCFIKLHLELNVIKSNDGTQIDYNNQKEMFYRRNQFRDTFMDKSESVNLSGFTEFNLVSVGKESPACINFWMYLLFTIIGFVELYKCYVDYYCISQKYRVVKEISSRRNLNVVENNEYFSSRIPTIMIFDQCLLRFENPEYCFLNEQNQPQNLPEFDEIQNSNGSSGQNYQETLYNLNHQTNNNNELSEGTYPSQYDIIKEDKMKSSLLEKK